MAHSAIHSRVGGLLPAALLHRVESLALRFWRWRQYESTLAALNALDQSTLDDLGLSRWSLPDVAHQAVYGTRPAR
ncbi:MAG: DUF1127 domain-containing protein [Pseudomonadota bacterium]